MSDTPRTDGFILSSTRTDWNWRQHARQLERELNAAKTEIQAMRDAIENANKQLEKYGENTVSHQGYSMCPHCNCIGVFDESHKDDCEIGSAIVKLQPFLK